jgi:hypothetical protein
MFASNLRLVCERSILSCSPGGALALHHTSRSYCSSRAGPQVKMRHYHFIAASPSVIAELSAASWHEVVRDPSRPPRTPLLQRQTWGSPGRQTPTLVSCWNHWPGEGQRSLQPQRPATKGYRGLKGSHGFLFDRWTRLWLWDEVGRGNEIQKEDQ